jgi:glycosyltransferase involved in cell wall biosynthesis
MLNRDFFEYLSSGDPRRGDLGRREFRLLRRHGHNLLAIPSALRFSRDALALYLPQTVKARAAKTLFKTLLHSPLASILPPQQVAISQGPMTDFLCAMTNGELPEFAVLLGNPAEPGRRFVIGVFAKNGECRKVVKCAIDPTGRELIGYEREVLSHLHGRFPGVPEVLATSDAHGFSAIAMEFFPELGGAMTRSERIDLARSWIWSDQAVALSSLPAWQATAARVDRRGSDAIVRPVVFHGDFTPWNLRRQGNAWTVIDWEKAYSQGPPLWDLLHYEVQTAILVDRLGARAVLQRLEDLIVTPSTQAYLKECRAEEIVQLLVDGYFHHADRHYPPIRGREIVDELINLRRHERDREQFRIRPARESYPDFTIVTPSFGQLPLLKLCVASVHDQVAGSNVSAEHLIQDAESPGIEDFEKELRRTFPTPSGPEYRLDLTSAVDEGMYDAINRGFRRANGEIVAWLNSDEQYLPGALAKVSSFFKAHPEIDVVFGDALVADLSGTPVAYRRCVLPDAWHTQLAQLGTFSCATFVRRRVLEQGLLPDPTLKAIADAKWIAEMKRSGVRMAVMPEALAVFMLTTTNLGQSSLAKLEMLRWRKQAGWAGDLLRRPVVAWYRLRKMLAGAYVSHSIETAFYLPDSPLQRAPCVARRLSHHWPGEQTAAEPTIGGPTKSTLIGWGVILPLLYSIIAQGIDRLAIGITLTPFLSIVCLLTMAFFLPPATIALAAVVFSASAFLSFLDFANMLTQETADTRFVLIRFASFVAAATGALMLSLYRQKAGRARALNASILTNMTVPLITSDAMGSVTFANARALQLLKGSDERIIGDKWTKLMMADTDQGTATRFYLSLFEGGAREQTSLLTLSSQPGKTMRANFICIGENQDRILLTTLENQEASDTAGNLNINTSAPAVTKRGVAE